MLQEFKEQYDFVILDTPTLSGGASAPILGKMADGLLPGCPSWHCQSPKCNLRQIAATAIAANGAGAGGKWGALRFRTLRVLPV